MLRKDLLRKDVSETICEESFSGLMKLLKELDWKYGMPPGPTVTHARMYNAPPPDSEFFTVEINLESSGVNKGVRYRLPEASVAVLR